MTEDLLIRPLEPRDGAALRFTFARLSGDARLQRYLAVKRRLSAAELAHLTAIDHWHHEAVLVLSPRPRMPIAVARYVRTDRFDVAEIAVEVIDPWQRRGVGTAVLGALSTRARASGIRRFRATLMATNTGALRLLRSAGVPTGHRAAAGVLELEVAL